MENIQPTFLSIGSPLVDAIVKVDAAFLEKYKLICNSASEVRDGNKELFEEISKFENCIYQAGGTASNTARVLQWIVGIPECSYFIGAVGKDDLGIVFEKKMVADNVGCYLQKIEDVPTGICAVLITQENRTLCTDLGASKKMHVDEKTLTIIKNCQYIYFTVFFF